MFAIAVIMLIPFLGMADFYSKGEPREAVVAYTMLEHGNWILPINNGGDIPYKPPFFHWCIAFFSLLPGYVNEFTSRLPSAVSLILMAMGGYLFIEKRKGESLAMAATMLLLTAFEVHRAGYACRVDMVLTACIVGAMYLMYAWWEKGKKRLPWMAILLMSAGTLTKGPIGIILPCLAMGVFMLTQRERFFGIVWRMALIAVLSLILPLCWYYAAYLQGGDAFLTLVMEENFGRFLGKMTYESHENPFWYNFITLITGWLPWTLLLVLSLFVLPWKSFSKTKLLAGIKKADKFQTFLWVAFLVVLVFYCIPKSKRSVYLLPCYPFMAVLLAEYFDWLCEKSRKVFAIYLGIFIVIGLLVVGTFVLIKTGHVPSSFFQGKHAAENIAYLEALQNHSLGTLWLILAAFPAIGALVALDRLRKHEDASSLQIAAFGMIFCLFFSLDGFYQPTVLNVKSDKRLAPEVEQRFDTDKLYSFIDVEYLHFFCLNFYLGDKIKQFKQEMPESGTLMIPEESMPAFEKEYAAAGYAFKKVWEVPRAVESRHAVGFYEFRRIPSHSQE